MNQIIYLIHPSRIVDDLIKAGCGSAQDVLFELEQIIRGSGALLRWRLRDVVETCIAAAHEEKQRDNNALVEFMEYAEHAESSHCMSCPYGNGEGGCTIGRYAMCEH